MTFIINPYIGSVVPSTTFIYKTTLTDTTDKLATETYTWAAQDLGTPHANRVIILGVVGGNFNGSTHTISVGGVTATFIAQNSSVANLLRCHLPSGATGDIVITVGTGGMSRAVVSYGVYYPLSPDLDFSENGSAAGTTDIVQSISAAKQRANGLIVAIAAQTATLGAFSGTWSGAESVTEHADAQIEATSSYAFYSITLGGGAPSTQNFTLAETVSGTKVLVCAMFGACF